MAETLSTSTAQRTPEEISAEMAARYGTHRSPWRTKAVAAVSVIAFFGTLTWVGLQLSDRPFEGQMGRWQAETAQLVNVTVDVRGESTEPVQCIVRVKDANAADVGYARIIFPTAPTTGTFNLATVAMASSAEVLGCANADEELTVPPAAYPPGVVPPPTQPLS